MRYRLFLLVCIGLLSAAFSFLPAYADDTGGQPESEDRFACSEEGEAVLKAIEAGNLEDKGIEVVRLEERCSQEELEGDFSGVVQDALDEAKANFEQNPGTLTRIVIPDGVYYPHGRALQIYSNTILDLRGSGADTADPLDDYNYDNYGNPVGKVVIYQSDMSDFNYALDPPSLRCGDQDDGSKGYTFYKNMTVLGGTFIGEDKNNTFRGNACNVRFGHASNIKVIGTQITKNQGGHHLEIGACQNVLVADCLFKGFRDGKEATNSEGLSLEAIQLDVSHREKNNFAYYGAYDDLPVIDAVVTDCTFENVRRGVGSHHAVFAHPYENIKIKNNTFRDIKDKAIYFVYTKNAEIYGNKIEDAVCGIAFQYLVPIQQFQPNDGKGKVTAPTDFSSASVIHDNVIRLDDTKGLDAKLTEAKAKYGIRVGGESVTAASGKTNGITAGTYHLCGVKVEYNDIGVSKGSKKGIRAGVLTDYAASCAVNNNIIDLKGYNEGSGESHAGILVSRSPNTGVASNTVKGVTNGTQTDSILVTSCGGKKAVTITVNKVYSPKRYGIHCYAVTNTALSVYKNTISNAGTAGIKVTKSKMHNVTTNTVTGTSMTEPGISITDSTTSLVNSNKISGTKQHGLFLSASTAYQVNNNTITKPGANGLMLYNGAKASYISRNTIDTPAKNGIIVYNKSNVVYSIYGNTVKNAKANGVLVGDDAKVTPRSKAFLIQANTLTSCKARGVSNGGWVNGIVANKVSKCGSSNKPYIKKGLTLCKYQVTVKKGKTCKLTYYKSYATKSKVYWSTSNKKVATVNKYGTVKGIKKGTAYIYAKRDGVKVKAKVTVK